MTGELSNTTALVTGAASGIGKATANALAQAGACLVLADRNSPEAVADTIRATGGKARAVTCDIADAESVRSLFETIETSEQGIDFAINAAGILSEGKITETPVEEFDRIIAVNLRGSFLIAQGAARIMRARKSGRIILVSSELAYLGRADFSAYCASKAGVVGMTRSLARELAPDIVVNTIAPGPIDTPMLALENMSQEWIEKEIDNPLGRVGTPEEIGALARFLCGPSAGFFTGQTLSPNGGAVMF
jgi:3-oxoacyl-[acyl-carrier protein] reductase